MVRSTAVQRRLVAAARRHRKCLHLAGAAGTALLIFACGGSTQAEPPEVVPALAVSSSGTLLGAPFTARSANAYVIALPAHDEIPREPAGVEVNVLIADWPLQCNDPGVDDGRSVEISLQFLGASTIPAGTYFRFPHQPTPNSNLQLTDRLTCIDKREDGDSVTISHHSAGYVAGSFAFESGLTGTFSVPFTCSAPTQAELNRPCTRLTDAAAND